MQVILQLFGDNLIFYLYDWTIYNWSLNSNLNAILKDNSLRIILIQLLKI